MKLRSLFRQRDKRKHVSPTGKSPLLQAMAAEIPLWPPQKRPLMERIVIEASAAGVSSPDELLAFLDAHPDLRAGFSMAMLGASGPKGQEIVSPTQPPKMNRGDSITIPSLGIYNLDLSSPEEMGAFLEEHPEKSIDFNTMLLKSAQMSGDRFGEAVVLGELGLAYARLNQMPKAIYYFERHLEIARELGNRQWEMEDYRNLGRAHLELGEIERAGAVYAEALLLAQQRGDRDWDIKHSFSLASVYARLGDLDRAEELTNHATALLNQEGR